MGFLPQVESGNLRLLAVTGSRRLTGPFSNTPTLSELGYRNAVSETWRAVLAPKGVTPAQIAYWEAAMYQVAASHEFRTAAERVEGEAVFKSAEQTRQMMQSEYAQARITMAQMGLIK